MVLHWHSYDPAREPTSLRAYSEVQQCTLDLKLPDLVNQNQICIRFLVMQQLTRWRNWCEHVQEEGYG